MLDQARGVHGQQRLRVGIAGGDLGVPGTDEGLADDVHPLDDLRAGSAHPQPDLGGGHVPTRPGMPHERDRGGGRRGLGHGLHPAKSATATWLRVGRARRVACWATMTSLADFGITVGTLPQGPTNSVLDVPGVGVGHTTIVRDEPAPAGPRDRAHGSDRPRPRAKMPGRVPWRRRRGAQRSRGVHRVAVRPGVGPRRDPDLPDLHDAAGSGVRRRLSDRPGRVAPRGRRRRDPGRGGVRRLLVELRRRDAGRVRRRGVRAGRARESIGSGVRPQTGAVGAGTGMLCLGWKGGIGTASRVLPSGHTLGILLLTNFGQWDRLTVGGVPVGRILGRSGLADAPSSAEDVRADSRRSTAGGLMPGDRGDRRAARHSRLPAPGHPHRPRAGAGGVRGPSRVRRDLPGPLGGHARTAGHPSRQLRDRVAPTWTRCSSPAWMPPRRRSSTRCSTPTTRVGHRGRRALALPHDALRDALAEYRP